MKLPVPLLLVSALFAAFLVFLVGAALAPKRIATYALGDSVPRGLPEGPDTVTLDARNPDRWVYFSFARGVLAAPDTAGWDLQVQRFKVIASGTARRTEGADSAGHEIGRWYRYSFFSHLLLPKPGAYRIQSPDGLVTELEFLSYYCPGPEAGCLTFRYSRAYSPSSVSPSGCAANASRMCGCIL